MSVWYEDALCQQVGFEFFFPESGENAHAARRVCRLCPVVDECLAEALRVRDLYGFRGGTTGEEREVMLRRPRRRVSRELVFRLRDEGWAVAAIAAKVRVHPSTVYVILQERSAGEVAA